MGAEISLYKTMIIKFGHKFDAETQCVVCGKPAQGDYYDIGDMGNLFLWFKNVTIKRYRYCYRCSCQGTPQHCFGMKKMTGYELTLIGQRLYDRAIGNR